MGRHTRDGNDETVPTYRRAILRTAGAGLLASAVSGVATGKRGGRKSGKSGTSGRPRLAVSTPDCETLRVDYVRGTPPVRVFVDGPESFDTRLDDGNRSAVREVEPGVYEVTAKPGNGGSKGNPAVVVEGSPITVETCERDLGAAFLCRDSGTGTYTLSNPRDVDVDVDHVWVQGDREYRDRYTVPAESTLTVPTSGAFVADGTWTHEFSATLSDDPGTTVPVNGESPWTDSPDCS
jgi:hypothetical protein